MGSTWENCQESVTHLVDRGGSDNFTGNDEVGCRPAVDIVLSLVWVRHITDLGLFDVSQDDTAELT